MKHASDAEKNGKTQCFYSYSDHITANNDLKRVPIELQYTTTKDGVDLALGRYSNPVGQPVILMHGLAQNYRVWDFPVEGHNFAHYLFERGYDVWLPCLRGHGSGVLQSTHFSGRENIDDHAIYDIPAIIDKIIAETSQKPIWVGHSLGGMLAYMYLQGVEYCQENSLQPATTFQTATGFDTEKQNIYFAKGNEKLSLVRNQMLKAVITVATPVKLTWKMTNFGKKVKLGFWKSNKILPLMAHSRALRTISSQLPYIPTASFFHFLEHKQQRDPSIFKRVTRWSVSRIANSYLASLLWYPPNMNKLLINYLLHRTLNDISPGVLEQFADWVEHKTFRAFPQANEQAYEYADNFHLITLPLLIITGNRDKIAPHDIVYQHGYQKMNSKNREYYCFEKFGHDDLCVGLRASRCVYPFLENRIQKFIRS